MPTLRTTLAPMRRGRRTLAVTAACLVAIGCGAQPALATPPPHDMLTGNEYTLLSAARLGLEAALSESEPNWVVAAQNACLTVTFGRPTSLLTTQKASCLSFVRLRVASVTFSAAYDRCARRGAKRATPCRAQLYGRLAGDAASAYAGELRANRAIFARGFRGACVTVMGSTPAQLEDTHKLVASTRRLAADWRLLVAINERRASPRRLKQERIDGDSTAVSRNLRLVLQAPTRADLSSCPHQTD